MGGLGLSLAPPRMGTFKGKEVLCAQWLRHLHAHQGGSVANIGQLENGAHVLRKLSSKMLGVTLICYRWTRKLAQPFEGEFNHISQNYIMPLSFDSPIPFLGTYPDDTPPTTWPCICTRLFITTLFIIVKCLERTQVSIHYRVLG